MSDDIPNGLTVYTEDGQQAEYLGRVENGHVVAVYGTFEGYDGEEFARPSALHIVGRVFRTAPVEVYDARVAERKADLAKVQEKIEAVREELRASQSERLQLVTKLKQVPVLRNIEDFIEGRITHFVRVEYDRYEIVVKDEALKTDSRYEQRLLSLFGDSKGDLQWRTNQYRDGSGGWTEVIPCSSEDEAKALRDERIAFAVAHEDGWKWLRAVEEAIRCGIELTPETHAKYSGEKRKALNQERDRAVSNSRSYVDSLAKIDAQLAALPLSPGATTP